MVRHFGMRIRIFLWVFNSRDAEEAMEALGFVFAERAVVAWYYEYELAVRRSRRRARKTWRRSA